VALTGTRTRLRAVEPADAEALYRWINDPEVTEYLSARYPTSLGEERAWAGRAAGHTGYARVTLAIETLDGELIGICLLRGQTPEDRTAELSIDVGEKRHWGRGYGGDAVVTLLRFAFHEMNLRRVFLRVDAPHRAAVGLYEKLGFRHEGKQRALHWTRGGAREVAVMAILREEFDERHGAHEEVGDVPRG